MNQYPTSPLRTALVAASMLVAASLTGCGSAPTQPESADLSAQTTIASGEHLLALSSDQWLALGPDSPIQLLHQGQQQGDVWQGSLSGEYLDARQHGDQIRAITLDHEQRLHLLTLSKQDGTYRISQDARSNPLDVALEGLCLYAPNGEDMQLFLLDESAIGHQMMLSVDSDAAETTLNMTRIRQFATAPGAEYCVTDDTTDRLFISEESTGLWMMNARAESDASRTMIDLKAPFGHLQGASGPVAIQQGSLWLAEGEGDRLHHYDLDSLVYRGRETIAMAEIDTLALLPSGNLAAGWFDKTDEQLKAVKLPSQAASNQHQSIANIAADAETAPVETYGDAADDPAVWVHPDKPQQSLIIGTNKKASLNVYDLQGELVQSLPVGRVNNVDVRQGFTLRGEAMDIAAASHRDNVAISLFSINPATGEMKTAGSIPTTLESVYGFCLYRSQAGEIHAFINSESGAYEQYRISDSTAGWQGTLVREFAVATQPEGCAADDRAERLFVGEEGEAVWTLGANADDSIEMTRVASVGDVLVADIEGVDVYQTAERNYLVVSSQGDDSYAVYQAEAPYEFLGNFRIGLNAHKGIDGASETDGLAVSSANLGPDYPQGILVVQDGRNLLPAENQNFKYVDWRKIQKLID